MLDPQDVTGSKVTSDLTACHFLDRHRAVDADGWLLGANTGSSSSLSYIKAFCALIKSFILRRRFLT